MAVAFVRVVEEGDGDDLRALVAEHPELTRVIDEPWFAFGTRALACAAGRLDHDLVDALLELGADLDARSEWPSGPYSALHGLVDGPTPERLEFAEHLVRRGATVDLHAAAGLGRVDRIEEILDAEPGRVDEPGPDGATPLHLARNPEVAAMLLDRGAEIDKRCVDHRSTPAMWATDGREDVMRYLLERGAKPDLFQAALLDDVSLAERIVAEDPTALDVRVRFGASHPHLGFGDKYVWALKGADTPVELARRRGSMATYAWLLERSSPDTRLLQAARRGDRPEMDVILDENPDLLASLPDAMLCEMLCASVEAVHLLLARGVDLDVRGEQHGATALHYAAWRGLPSVALALLEGGADAASRDRDFSATPLGWARVARRDDMITLLRDHGARE